MLDRPGGCNLGRLPTRTEAAGVVLQHQINLDPALEAVAAGAGKELIRFARERHLALFLCRGPSTVF